MDVYSVHVTEFKTNSGESAFVIPNNFRITYDREKPNNAFIYGPNFLQDYNPEKHPLIKGDKLHTLIKTTNDSFSFITEKIELEKDVMLKDEMQRKFSEEIQMFKDRIQYSMIFEMLRDQSNGGIYINPSSSYVNDNLITTYDEKIGVKFITKDMSIAVASHPKAVAGMKVFIYILKDGENFVNINTNNLDIDQMDYFILTQEDINEWYRKGSDILQSVVNILNQ